jgi:hypothetical protein
MRLWHLIPVDLLAIAWSMTSYKGPVVVRAGSEQQARELACRDLSAADVPLAADVGPPWIRPEVVRAEPLEDDQRYPAAGKPGVLELS